MKKWFRIAIVIIPIILILVSINYYIDPGNIFNNKNVSYKVSESILKRNAAYPMSGNMDEKSAREYLIKNISEKPDCVAIGPSLIMLVDSDMVGTDSFWNLGESRANFYDIFAQFGMMDANKIMPHKVILCIDTMMFDSKYAEANKPCKSQMDYANYMIEKVQNGKAEIPEKNNADAINLKELFSISYFQASIDYLGKKTSNSTAATGIVNNGNYSGAYWCPDGHYVYSKAFQATTLEGTINYEKNYFTESQEYITPGAHMDKNYTQTFEQLIDYLQNKGTDVVFYLCPYPQTLWNELVETQNYPLIFEIEDYIKQYAKEKNIRVTGSYNPETVGATEKDFYDARHLRPEALQKYFDFKSK